MLLDILQRIAEEYGDDTSESSIDRAKIVARVNRAAKEVHNAYDIRESLTEGVFTFNVSSQQVALPAHIGEARFMRWSGNREKIDLDDIRNRYGYSVVGNEPWDLKFRKLKPQPIEREINNESSLIASIPFVEGSAFNVAISGKTANAERRAETLAFGATTLAVGSVSNFQEPIISITKDKATQYDITIKDVEDNVIAVIPNNARKSLYNVYQIIDTDNSSLNNNQNGVEILYKIHFTPIETDYDSFWGVEDYDDVIFWKYSERNVAKDTKAQEKFYAKSVQAYMDAVRDEEAGQRRKMKLKGNKFMRLRYARERYC